MAPRRATKSVKVVNSINYHNLKLSESLCPICRSILIEPVTLACNHGFCLSCFEATMANANLVCPFCRLRIGSWLRNARRENKLVNEEYWQALKEQFPTQIQNRLLGLEENLPEEVPKIRLSNPGEIRKEFEAQKRKEDEELMKIRAIEEKASESLIQQYQRELEYQKTVEEEKIRFDEQVARRLAEKLAQTGPSTSKFNSSTPKKTGTLDSFLKSHCKAVANTPPTQISRKSAEHVTYTSNMQKNVDTELNSNVMLNNYANKEYRSIVLTQNKATEQPTSYNGVSNASFIKKRSQQLQKLIESECGSDSSDCIESECRYFKPVDYKYIPRSSCKPAIKVPSKIGAMNFSAIVRPPSGANNFEYNSRLSAFARVHSPIIVEQGKSKPAAVISNKKEPSHSFVIEEEENPPPIAKRKHHKSQNSPNKKIKATELGESTVSTSRLNGVPAASESPPFCGFTRVTKPKLNNNNINNVPNGFDIQEVRRLQEKADLEYAKRLQAELDSFSRYPTRSSKTRSGRQVTLEEMIMPYKIK